MSGDVTPPIPPADSNPPAGSNPSGVPVPPAPEALATPQGPERVLRGFLLSLIVIPVGIAVFTLIWNLGFVSAIVGFGVAFGAFFLYKLGSGGRISVLGAILITAVTLLTLVIAYPFATIVSPFANHLAATEGYSWFGLVIDPSFWAYAINFQLPFIGNDFFLWGGLTLLFGALGCFSLLRGVFQQAIQGNAPAQ